jgi:transglutaminase superfamily protein/coenzyme PQQ synthesis protein D (PqqD)
LSPSVLLVAAPDGSGRLFDLEGSFYAVEPVGAQMLRDGLSKDREAAVRDLARRYGVDAGRIREDYIAFFQDLERRKLLYARAHPAAAPSRSRFLTTLLRPLIALVARLPLTLQTWAWLAAARVSIRIFGWNETMRAWLKYHCHASTLRGVGEEVIRASVRSVAATHLLGVSCKERSLCCWSLCRAAGVPAWVVLGISLFPLASHCWCETAAGCLTDFPDRCEGFTPVLKYR